jgi:hypothetical protein
VLKKELFCTRLDGQRGITLPRGVGSTLGGTSPVAEVGAQVTGGGEGRNVGQRSPVGEQQRQAKSDGGRRRRRVWTEREGVELVVGAGLCEMIERRTGGWCVGSEGEECIIAH